MLEQLGDLLALVVFAITTLAIMTIGFLMMARGPRALADLRIILLGAGAAAVSLGWMVIGLPVMLWGCVLAVRAWRLERTIIEGRARRIGRGGAARH